MATPEQDPNSGIRAEWRTISRGRMHARVADTDARHSDPPVVLVHGLVISSAYMVPLMQVMRGDFRVYAPDLPGFGDSDKPPQALTLEELADALAEWIDTMALDRPVLLGNSLGCQIMLHLAVRHPDKVRALILQGPTDDPGARSALRQIARLAVNATREPSFGLMPARDYWKAGLGRARRTFQYLLADRPEQRLPLVRQPTLVVRGSVDPVVSAEWASRIVDLLPDARLRVLPGLAHTINFHHPLELHRVSRPFILQQTEARQAARMA
ncbi:alpha/beta hydrolase [Ectothiorhodospiraceae bacterium 2226]|nr:alpha/beta hydrolase [Ectothiorhodospiraceae bacterium 2226]